jgi:DNA-binding NarL/FixJ family response regulator
VCLVPERHAAEGVQNSEHHSAPGKSAERLLTDRQIEILTQVARGGSNRQVGKALGISERTVRNHLLKIARKLSTSDRTRAVVLAIERGWIALPIEPEGQEPAVPHARLAEQTE